MWSLRQASRSFHSPLNSYLSFGQHPTNIMIELQAQSTDATRTLTFHDGSLVLEGEGTPCPLFRQHGGKLRAMPANYKKVIEWLTSHGIAHLDEANLSQPIDATLQTAYEDRPYQREALGAWIQAGCAGRIVLPTGSGKTLAALRAIEYLGRSTLVVLPTLDLMNQWYEILASAFREPVGILGGGYHDVKPLTVTTYDSAFRYVDLYGNRFDLLVFDKVHHLPSESYAQIAELSIAPPSSWAYRYVPPHRWKAGGTNAARRTAGVRTDDCRLQGKRACRL